MQVSNLLRAHRRLLIAQRLHAHAAEVFDPGAEASYRRMTKADDLLEIAQKRYRLLVEQGLHRRR